MKFNKAKELKELQIRLQSSHQKIDSSLEKAEKLWIEIQKYTKKIKNGRKERDDLLKVIKFFKQ